MKLHRPLVLGVLHALDEIFNHARYSDKVLEALFKNNPRWGARDRRFVAEAVYEIVRWFRHYHALSGEFWSDERIWNPQEQPFPEALFRYMLDRWLDQPVVVDEQHFDTARTASCTDWLFHTFEGQFGAQTPELLKHVNRKAPLYLRTNLLKTTPEELLSRLSAEEVEGICTDPAIGTIRLSERSNVFRTEAFKQGLFEVQDAGSQRIAPFVGVTPGLRVIDACAGGGGKTLHLAALMQHKGSILALDVHARKLEELRKRARRAGVHMIEARPIVSSKTIKRLKHSADRVLLDVPCSGLGVMRRNPDSKWRLTPQELQRLCGLQLEILTRYGQMVKPGGKLIYATCSLLQQENRAQVDALLQRQPGIWQLEQDWYCDPLQENCDGFYAARLLRLQ